MMTPQGGEKGLALFDFDGTLTRKDTLFEIIKFDQGLIRFLFGFLILSPFFFLYFLKLIPAQTLKEKYFGYFLENRSIDNWNDTCEKFSKEIIPKLIRKEALIALEKHKIKKNRIVVVSASLENWIEPWCRDLGIECLGSKLEISRHKITGRLMGANCNGAEKVRRIKEYLHLETYSPIYAYGDSKGDWEMLKISDYPFFRNFPN